VWVRVDASGAPAAGSDGRVDVLYRAGGKVYRASARNLEDDPAAEQKSDAAMNPAGTADKPDAKPSAKPDAKPAPANAVIVYTDGACTGNPGPMGIGVVIVDGADGSRKELSEYLGHGTNNIAELTAIKRALEECPRDRAVIVHSDSSYVLGLLGQNWKAKANQALVADMRLLAKQFSDVRWVKVRGHSGVPENERCDELARQAVARGR
jgi:ribonuclease HI